MRKLVASTLVLLGLTPQARAEWPQRVFAPYMYVGYGDDFKLTTGKKADGHPWAFAEVFRSLTAR